MSVSRPRSAIRERIEAEGRLDVGEIEVEEQLYELQVRGERPGEGLEVFRRQGKPGQSRKPVNILRCHRRGHSGRVYEVCDSPPMTFDETVQELLDSTGASRTTLRLDRPEGFFPVVAEALAPGVKSIAADSSIDLEASPTFQFLQREQRLLIQPDLLAADPAPPPELIELYGARAQMLAPLVQDERLIGILSVHYAPGPREWTAAEVSSLEQAVERVLAELN